MDKLKLHSPDLTAMNIDKIAELFPNCITEAKAEDGSLKRAVDFDLLRQELSGDLVEGPQERYRLDWPGKREALATANAPIAKTLRPCREESVDFETTKNLYVEGDNLDALKLLQETYLGKVKMIYIDPPYNTGNDFIYDDNYSMSRAEYERKSGMVDEEGNQQFDEEKWQQNSGAHGRFHSEWLSMMYPRLKLARNFLNDDGVIVTHIDENELPNLEKLLKEIFGDTSQLGTVVWDKRNPKGKVVGVAQQHELILFFSKDRDAFANNCELKKKKKNAAKILEKAKKLIASSGRVDEKARKALREWMTKQDFSGGEKAYCHLDDEGKVFRPVSMAAPDKPETRSHRPLLHPSTGRACPVPEKGWRYTDKTMDALLKSGGIVFGVDETTQPNRKYRLEENLHENLSSLLYYGGSDDALLKSLGIPFDNPKPVAVAAEIIDVVCGKNDLIVDFFSGSATTAHAVMMLNSSDGGGRTHIQIQLPEPCAEKSEAFKAGYATIAEIGKERIRRAGAMIRDDLQSQLNETEEGSEEHQTLLNRLANLDTGFRVLKVDSSNMADVYYTPDKVTQDGLDIQVENIKPDRTPEDLLFQVLLDWGVDLALPIEQETIDGKTVFFVDGNALAACFDPGLDEDFVKTLAKREPLRAVFRDASFATDATKINIEQIFKALSPHTELKAI